jgi:hypothetical protein
MVADTRVILFAGEGGNGDGAAYRAGDSQTLAVNTAVSRAAASLLGDRASLLYPGYTIVFPGIV